MTDKPTYDDANLILRLYELRREEKLRQAREWFAQQFKPAKTIEELMAQCPPGSQANSFYRMVTSYWDMAASFVTTGVLNQEMLLQSAGELLFVWTKAKDVTPHMRKLFANPKYLANLETVGNAAIARMNESDPKAYETFVERVIYGMAAQAASKS